MLSFLERFKNVNLNELPPAEVTNVWSEVTNVSSEVTNISSRIGKWSACFAVMGGILFIGYKIKTVFFDVKYAAKQTCRTIEKSKVYLNEWTIEKFANAKSGVMKSVEFSGTTIDGNFVTWSYLLNPINNNGTVITIKAQSESENFHDEAEIELPFFSKSFIINREEFPFNRHAILQDWIARDGSLKLVFRVTFSKNFLKGPSENLPLPPPSSLEQNFAALLSSMQFSDITVRVGKRTFQAHKCVFAARSSVFAAMFQHDMQESQRNEIIIPNMDPEVFEEVLRFIYTDNAEGLPRMAFELLEVAEKYDLARLKALCEIELLSGITTKSATKTLELADLYRAAELKSRTMKEIVKNCDKIPNWEAFCSSRPDLVADILATISNGHD